MAADPLATATCNLTSIRIQPLLCTEARFFVALDPLNYYLEVSGRSSRGLRYTRVLSSLFVRVSMSGARELDFFGCVCVEVI